MPGVGDLVDDAIDEIGHVAYHSGSTGYLTRDKGIVAISVIDLESASDDG